MLYYKYVPIEDPEAFMREHRVLCQRLNLKGRIIIAHEGLNGTVEGLKENTEEYVRVLQSDPRFTDIDMKYSVGTGNAFPRLSIKVRPEIVSLHLKDQDFSPRDVTGKYLYADELHEWITSGKEFYIVDMRNDYEHKVGHFEGSFLPEMRNFRDLNEVLPELESLKDKTVLTVCTGGVRCEKASGFLMKNGFNDVYQLYGGIVTYMEKYPNEHFKGALYVFDGRVVMHFDAKNGGDVGKSEPRVAREIVGRCAKCEGKTENYADCANMQCHRHFLCCTNCTEPDGSAFCELENIPEQVVA